MLSKLSSKSSIRICIHFTFRVEALNEIYFFFSHSFRRMYSYDSWLYSVWNETTNAQVYDHQLEKSYLDGGGGREIFSFSNYPWDTV